jgi:23S rRNA (adenine2503-C2)-methyltransferase
MTDLPLALRERLESTLLPSLQEVGTYGADRDQTKKWLWSLHDGARIETVFMAYPDRSTVCISSQAGCAMACTFCATGQAGFKRHLRKAEIVEQVIAARREADSRGRRLSNIVFMGMGEPLANYDTVIESVGIFNSELAMGARHITISTVGLIPGIRRLTTEPRQLTLAVSLHAANNEKRNALVPINKRYPLEDLHAACLSYVTKTGRRLSIEWALMKDTNDSLSDAKELAEFVLPLRAHVNLIPLNPTPGFGILGTDKRGVEAFVGYLEDRSVNATVRTTRGMEIDAACGQLAARGE